MPIRGTARIVGMGRVDVAEKAAAGASSRRGSIVVGRGLELADSTHGRTRLGPAVDATGRAPRRRTLPRSLLIMGGGPTGVELAQVYARYGVGVTIVDSNDRIVSRDHPRNSAALTEALQREGVTVRTGVRAVRADAGAGADGAHRVGLSDGSSVEGHAVLVAIGRAIPTDGPGAGVTGHFHGEGLPQAGRATCESRRTSTQREIRRARSSTPTSPTTKANWWCASRWVTTSCPTSGPSRAPPTPIPETASVGLRLDEAEAAGHSAIERTADVGTSAKGYVSQSSRARHDRGGHEGSDVAGRLHRRARRVRGDPRDRAGGQAEGSARRPCRYAPRLPDHRPRDGRPLHPGRARASNRTPSGNPAPDDPLPTAPTRATPCRPSSDATGARRGPARRRRADRRTSLTRQAGLRPADHRPGCPTSARLAHPRSGSRAARRRRPRRPRSWSTSQAVAAGPDDRVPPSDSAGDHPPAVQWRHQRAASSPRQKRSMRPVPHETAASSCMSLLLHSPATSGRAADPGRTEKDRRARAPAGPPRIARRCPTYEFVTTMFASMPPWIWQR